MSRPADHIYRAYIIGADGLIIHRVELDCDDEEGARTRAKALVDGHDVELWDGSQKLATFKPPAPKS